MNQNQLNKNLESKATILETVPDKFINSLKAIELILAKAIRDLVNKFDTKGGKLSRTNRNSQRIQRVHPEVMRVMKSKNVDDRLQAFLRNFDKIASLNNLFYNDFYGLTFNRIVQSSLNSEQKRAIGVIVTQLTGSNPIDQNISRFMRVKMENAIARGASVTELNKEITKFITGQDGSQGQLRKYTRTFAQDSLSQYDGVFNKIVYDEFDFDGYNYVGPLVADSRPQCIRWAGNFLTNAKLPSEVRWANNNGSGYPSGTILTTNNFPQLRGGIRCNHFAIPGFKDDNERNEMIANSQKEIETLEA